MERKIYANLVSVDELFRLDVRGEESVITVSFVRRTDPWQQVQRVAVSYGHTESGSCNAASTAERISVSLVFSSHLHR